METENMTTPVDGMPQAPVGVEEAVVTEHQPSAAVADDVSDDAADTHAAEASVISSEVPDEAVYLPIYNGETIPVKASDREQITTLLQLGMKQRDLLPVYEQMTRLARDDGARSITDWVGKMVKAREEKRLSEAIERFGEQDGRAFHAMEREQRERRYRALEAEEQQRRERQLRQQDREMELAEEFFQLQIMHPQVVRMSDVPDEALRLRHEERIPLADAYNRAMLTEQRRADSAAAKSREAAKTATGSLASVSEAPTSAIDAFRAGLRRRM